MTRLVLALFASVSLLSLAACDNTSLAGADSNPIGRQDHQLVVDGQTRDTILYVGAPAASLDAPVVFVFHGTSQDGEKFYSDSGWRQKADAEGLIIVFPTALTYCYKEDDNGDGDYDDPGEGRISTKWTHGTLGEADGLPLCTPEELQRFPADRQAKADHPLQDDVAFVDAMRALLLKSYRVDPKRFYLTGFSNGAGFTSRLVKERSTVFAVAAPGSGNLQVEPALAERPMSVMHWMGSKDDRFIPVDVTVAVNESLLTTYPLFKSRVIGPFLTTLGLADSYVYSEQHAGSRTIATFTFATSLVGGTNSYSFSMIEGMFHVYPAGTPVGIFAADFAWELFAGESL